MIFRGGRVKQASFGWTRSAPELGTDPGRMVPPHVHAHEDEFSYILEGEIGARIGDEVLQATTGSYVFKPRGLPHTFWNATTKPAITSREIRGSSARSALPRWRPRAAPR